MNYRIKHLKYDIYHPEDSEGRFSSYEAAQDFVDTLPDSAWWGVEHAEDKVKATDSPLEPMRNYLVYEAQDVEQPQTSPGYLSDRQIRERAVYKSLYNTFPIAVRAVNEEEAVKAVMATTRRISKYAVVEAVFIDFTQSLSEPDSIRAELNP